MVSRRVVACGLGLTLILVVAAAGASERPVGVSPGSAERGTEAASACPTFSWGGVAEATGYRLAVLRIDGVEEPELVWSQQIAGAALAWTPPRAACLAAGHDYVWVVAADLVDLAEPQWSVPLRFRVPGGPSAEELAAAWAVIERWRVAVGDASGEADDAVGVGPPEGRRAEPTAGPRTPDATGVAAVRGEIPDLSGSAYGVLGIELSPQGAGVVARNQSTGADLILDGEAQGQADTLLTQAGIDRPSASAQSFDIGNSGAGTLTLRVDGVAVSKEGHTHGGEAIVSGLVAEPRIAATLARDSEVMPLVLAADGAGSTLDADLLDGAQASAFAASSHSHAGEAITTGTVADARIAASLARDSEVMPVVLANDGEGSGIDADYLDGWHASSIMNHDHLGELWTGSGGGLWIHTDAANDAAFGGQNAADDGYAVYAASTNAAGGYGVAAEAVGGTAVLGVAEGGTGGHFASDLGSAILAWGYGAWRDYAALKVFNYNSVGGIAAYFSNQSPVATIHAVNSGDGEVLYLQNASNELGYGGGDFIKAVIYAETNSRFRVDSVGAALSDVGFYTPAQDFAELVPAAAGLEPGDVLAIGGDGRLERATVAYSRAVAGVYSTAPGFVGGHPVDGEAPADQVPLAVVGIVPVKASAENGAIAPGDLLVAAATPGHAMHAGGEPPNGSVIGKALEPHAGGLGVIRMLVVLQ